MNYNEIMEKELNSLNGYVPRILLHSCCAPCSSHVIDVLTHYADLTIFYYNPNIEPLEEYLKRKEEEIRFINSYKGINKLNIIDCDYDNDKFHEIAKNLEEVPEGGARCFKCYRLRMEATAIKAKELGYDYFATTLTVSPLKNSKVLNEIGKSLSKEYQIKYLYSDFKKKDGYKHSIAMAREYNLYRQDYCGCIYSKEAREKEKLKKMLENK